MKFEVVNRDGQVVMWTDSVDCIPAPNELDVMTSAGYRYKIDGKIVSKSKITETVGVSKPTVSVIREIGKHNKSNHSNSTEMNKKYQTNHLF